MLERKKYSLIDAVRINFISAPLCSALALVARLVSGLMPAIKATASALFIDTALRIIAGAQPYDAIYGPLALVAGLVAYGWLMNNFVDLANERRRIRVLDQYRPEMVGKCARLEYRHIEDPETWDLITKVMKDPDQQIAGSYDDLLGALELALNILSVIGLLLFQVWWAALVTVLFSVPLARLALRGGQENYQSEREAERATRKSNDLRDVMISRETAEERALFGYTPKLSEEYMTHFLSAYRTKFRIRRKWFVRMKLGSSLFSLISIGVALTLIAPTVNGTITIGMFMSLINAAFGLVQAMSWNLTYITDQLAKRNEYLKDMSKFAALEECEGATDAPVLPPIGFQSLEMRDVRFTYPGTDREILSGLSLRMEAGHHYAFVGINGAGKTTLTKLLTGLYDQYEGEILLNGRDLRSYTQAELKSLYALAYQDFARYSVSVRDAVSLHFEDRQALVEPALRQVGLFDAVAALPRGLDTPLGKILNDGTDLSGGQWQRMAIARALVSPAPVRILDEPTAALDPISESHIYSEFHRMSGEVTTLFISHRLGSTLLADKIFVIGEGVVLEEGNHAALMAKGGLYAEMYEAQRSWYQ